MMNLDRMNLHDGFNAVMNGLMFLVVFASFVVVDTVTRAYNNRSKFAALVSSCLACIKRACRDAWNFRTELMAEWREIGEV